MKYALPVWLLLTGCSSTAWQVSSGTPHANANVQVQGGSGLAAIFGLSILAAGIYEVSRGGLAYASQTPEMAPDRKISEQDCSKPLDHTLGNIRCK